VAISPKARIVVLIDPSGWLDAAAAPPVSPDVPVIYSIRMAEREKTNAERYEEMLTVHGEELAFNDDGVDLTQIRESLGMAPIDRLRLVSRWAQAILRARVVNGP
jgi:hypothetical protein